MDHCLHVSPRFVEVVPERVWRPILFLFHPCGASQNGLKHIDPPKQQKAKHQKRMCLFCSMHSFWGPRFQIPHSPRCASLAVFPISFIFLVDSLKGGVPEQVMQCECFSGQRCVFFGRNTHFNHIANRLPHKLKHHLHVLALPWCYVLFFPEIKTFTCDPL